MNRAFTRTISCVLVLAAAGCSWVKPTPEGEQVRLLEIGQVSECEKRGTTMVSVLDKLAGLRRSHGKVAAELANLARNSAVQLGGNAIVPSTEIVDGSQTFTVFRC